MRRARRGWRQTHGVMALTTRLEAIISLITARRSKESETCFNMLNGLFGDDYF